LYIKKSLHILYKINHKLRGRYKVKIDTISINLLGHSLSHASSSEVKTMKFEKKGFYQKALAYIEDYMTKNGYDLVNVHGSEQMYVYHLIKR